MPLPFLLTAAVKAGKYARGDYIEVWLSVFPAYLEGLRGVGMRLSSLKRPELSGERDRERVSVKSKHWRSLEEESVADNREVGKKRGTRKT